MTNLKPIDKKTCSIALGLSKKILNFDFLISLYFMKNIMYKTKILTEKLEATELNIIDALILITHAIDSLVEMRDDNKSIDNLIECGIIFAKKLNIDPDADFNRHHRRRLQPKKIDENSDTQCTFNLKTFYKMEFKEVFNTLITLLSEHLKNNILIVEPLIHILKVPREKNSCSTDNLEKAMKIFPPGCDEFKINDFDGVLTELDVLHHQCTSKNIFKLIDMLKVSEELKHILPTSNKVCRLIFTAPVSTASNERAFSKLKIVKNYLRSTMKEDPLQNLMLLNCNKDFTDSIDIDQITKHWGLIKERQIIV